MNKSPDNEQNITGGDRIESGSTKGDYSQLQAFSILRLNWLLQQREDRIEALSSWQDKLLNWAIRSVFDDCKNLELQNDAELLLRASAIEGKIKRDFTD